MQNADRIWNLIDAKREDFLGLSDRIWEMPEIAYTEYRSVEEHRKMLETQGFAITENPAGIPTAVIGEAGPHRRGKGRSQRSYRKATLRMPDP